MENETCTVSGVVDDIRFRNEKNGYTVLDLDTDEGLVCAVGTMPDINVGDSVEITGVVTAHPTYGEQLSVKAYVRSAPSTVDAIYKYLSKRTIKGVGPSLALKLVQKFGEDTLDVMEKEPEKLTTIRGISLQKANEISEQVKKTFGLRELLLYLTPFGIRPEETARVWEKLGADAQKKIERNPYIMCEEGMNVSFDKADRIAAGLHDPVDADLRVRAALSFILTHNIMNGHTCLPRTKLIKACADFTKRKGADIEPVLDKMIDEAALYREVRERDGLEFIFLPLFHRAETYAASRLSMLLRFPPQRIDGIDAKIASIEREQDIRYADLQKTAIHMALEQGLLILTGGPGTGKTTTLNAIIKILSENGETVYLAAPTGRAAQRMSELTNCEAKTIHRLLEAALDENGRSDFRRNETNPLACTALILDEASMIDAQLLESIMRAFPLGCRLIFVGDSDQLPSVGAGNVLGDMIGSGKIPLVELNEVFRQSAESLIIENAHRINSGESPMIKNNSESDFFFLECKNDRDALELVTALCKTRLPKAYKFSPMSDIQVLAPSKMDVLGVESLNESLQEALNPQQDDAGKTEYTARALPLREGDKVIQNKNNYTIPWSKDNGTMGEGVFNGDIGVLTKIDSARRELTVTFDDKTAKYPYEFAGELDLAYCTTIHKSQGNEFEAVVLPLGKMPRALTYRNLLYTAVTRAKKLLIIVGSREVMEAMVKNNKRTLRYTLLDDLIARMTESGDSGAGGSDI